MGNKTFVEVMDLPYSENLFFKKSFIWLVQTDFLSSGKNVFDQRYFSAGGTVVGIRGKQFSKKELALASGQLTFRLV